MIIIKDKDFLKEEIKKRCTILEFAKMIGVERAYIYLILQGRKNITPKIAIKICQLTEHSFDSLFYIDDGIKNEPKK